MDFTSPWTIVAAGLALLAVTVIPGVYLWWPSRSQELAKSDLGLALMTGALIAFSVLFLEFMLTQRARKLESQRQAEAEKQALQLLVGRQRNLAGIDLGCSVAENGNCGEVLDDFYLNGKILREANLRGSSLLRARLQDAHLEQAVLAGAKLGGASMDRAHLERAILDGANLAGARLRFANLEGARLRRAGLVGADLNFAVVRADLEGARLMGAELFGADLQNANLEGAKLQRADLRSASLRGANLVGADLRRAKVEGAEFAHARYDAKTQWPFESRSRWPTCPEERCTVRPVRGTERVRTEARRQMAIVGAQFQSCLPNGWVVSPRDPAGFTFAYPIHRARFFGERRPQPPGSDLQAFAHEWRNLFASEYPGFNQIAFGPAPLQGPRRALQMDEGRVWINRFEYRVPSARNGRADSWERIEIYGVSTGARYRFVGEAPSDVFMLFARDFGELYSTLGVDPRRAFRSLSDVRTCHPKTRAVAGATG